MRGEMELVREERGGEGRGRGGGEEYTEKVVGLGFESRGYVVEIGLDGRERESFGEIMAEQL